MKLTKMTLDRISVHYEILILLSVIAILSICIPGLSSVSAQSVKSRHDDSAAGIVSSFQPVINPDVPMKMKFAGKTVEFDRLDMYERLDRELTSMIYGHGNTLLTLKRANRYAPIIIPILKKNNVPTDLFYLAAVESYFNPRAYSPAKAAGIWQFLATTGKQFGLEINDEVDERYCPEKSTVAATKYLKKAYEKYGDWPTVMASYNCGMTRMSKELESQIQECSNDLYLNDETSRYVFRIFAMKLILENPELYGFILSDKQLYQPIDYKIVEVKGGVQSWSEWAKKHGISYAQLRDANPWIRKNVLTNKLGKTYKVKVPKHNELYRSKRKFETYDKNLLK